MVCGFVRLWISTVEGQGQGQGVSTLSSDQRGTRGTTHVSQATAEGALLQVEAEARLAANHGRHNGQTETHGIASEQRARRERMWPSFTSGRREWSRGTLTPHYVFIRNGTMLLLSNVERTTPLDTSMCAASEGGQALIAQISMHVRFGGQRGRGRGRDCRGKDSEAKAQWKTLRHLSTWCG